MHALDNMTLPSSYFQRKGPKTYILAAAIAVAVMFSGCRKAAPEQAVAPSDRSVGELIAEADQLYAQRADVVKVRQGLIILRQATAANPSDYEVAWRLAKFNYYVGAHSSDAALKEKAFYDGTEAGKLAIKFNDNRPEGHFWLGANYGGNAEISTLAGLSDIEDIKREMETVLKLDHAYEGASAYMALGQTYMKAPRILGGDLSKAIEYLEKGIKVGPNNGLMRLRLAQAYADAHRKEDARKQIEVLLSITPSPGYEPEYNDAVKEARELQEKIK
ncbi:MAG TPA: TRAP transporter TatT component family protein [Pyrinomonadaceae bacterium]|nr:TRAP transporter TatT component family protein [Pyrinomonadaceae bacterium]